MRAENILYSRENAEILVGRKLRDDEYYYDILENVMDKVDIENCNGIFAIGNDGVTQMVIRIIYQRMLLKYCLRRY